MKIAVTGHRPGRIRGKEGDIKRWIREVLKQEKEKNGGNVSLICGMAEGVDQIAALAAIGEDIDVECYFACKHSLKGVEEYIADKAAEVRFIREKYQAGCFFDRDRRMVDDCDLLLVVWDGKENGGTYYTCRYALEEKVPVLLYPWISEKELSSKPVHSAITIFENKGEK